jgi:hypothetical protein
MAERFVAPLEVAYPTWRRFTAHFEARLTV